MFGNRAVSVQLVKTPKQLAASGEPVEVASVDIDKISNLVLDHTHNLAKVAGGVYIAKRVIDTACEIAVIIAKKKL